MQAICITCGTQYPATATRPATCPICQDERQYVNWNGQQWTTLADLQVRHRNVLREVEPHMTGIATEPAFAIGQRALLVQTPSGNVLWDCISLIDQATIDAVNALGGIAAIAISHPHFYSSMVEWSRAFDAPIHLHADNRPFVMHPDLAITYWAGETVTLLPGVTLIRCGGHFPGSTVLHWAEGGEGGGALLTGDTIMVAQDRRFVSFMYSYPNLLPLPASAVRRIADAVKPYRYDRLYAGWWDKVVDRGADAAVARSAQRYAHLLERD